MEMLKVQIVILVMMELLDFHNALGHVIVRMKGQLAAMKLANVFARIILKEYLAIMHGQLLWIPRMPRLWM